MEAVRTLLPPAPTLPFMRNRRLSDFKEAILDEASSLIHLANRGAELRNANFSNAPRGKFERLSLTVLETTEVRAVISAAVIGRVEMDSLKPSNIRRHWELTCPYANPSDEAQLIEGLSTVRLGFWPCENVNRCAALPLSARDLGRVMRLTRLARLLFPHKNCRCCCTAAIV